MKHLYKYTIITILALIAILPLSMLACNKDEYVSLHYQTNNGSDIPSVRIKMGNSAVRPKDPTKDGYQFAEWFVDSDCNIAFGFETILLQDTTIYAKWKDILTIFPDNPETLTPEVEPSNLIYNIVYYDAVSPDNPPLLDNPTHNTTPHLPNAYNAVGNRFSGVFTDAQNNLITQVPQKHTNATQTVLPNAFKLGYDFLGCFSEIDASGTVIQQLGESIQFDSDIFLYAKWSAREYTINFQSNKPNNANGQIVGLMQRQTTQYDNIFTLRPNQFALQGYSFLGWATSKDGNIIYTDAQQVSNIILHPSEIDNPSLTPNQLNQFNQFNPTNKITTTHPQNIPTTIILYAVWKSNAYTVVLDYANKQDKIILEYGQPYQLPIVEKYGHQFKGWYNADKQRTDGQGNSLSPFWDGQNTILTPQHSANNYTITIDTNGGSGGDSTIQATFGQYLPVPIVPTQIGYQLLGYFVDKNTINSHYITQPKNTIPTQNPNQLNSPNPPTDIILPNLITSPKKPTPPNKIPDNYIAYIDSHLHPTRQWDLDTSQVQLIVLWKPIQYTLTLDANGGTTETNSLAIFYQDKLPDIPPPTRNEYQFNGYFWQDQMWYDPNMNPQTTMLIAQDITLTALWLPTIHLDMFQFTPYTYLQKDEQGNITQSVQGYEISAKSDTQYLQDYSGIVQLPSHYNNLPILRIADNGFHSDRLPNNNKVKGYIIPNTVHTIGRRAFYQSNATTISFPQDTTLITIQEYAFAYSNLTTITLPSTVQQLQNYAIYNCLALQEILIPNDSQLTQIGEYAFAHNKQLTIASIPPLVTNVGKNIFYQCYNQLIVEIYVKKQDTTQWNQYWNNSLKDNQIIWKNEIQ